MLDDELKKFAARHLDEEYPYLILDARYEKVCEDGVILTRAVMIAIGINRNGRRSILAVEVANRKSPTSWREFRIGLKTRLGRRRVCCQRRSRWIEESDR
jgi:putative transposase